MERKPYWLGLDLGSNSIGWAVIELDADKRPCNILAGGSRIFEAGTEGDLETGRDTPRGVQRRTARLARRRLFRRANRKVALFRLLSRFGLLPAIPEGTDAAQLKLLQAVTIANLDEAARERMKSRAGDNPHRYAQVFPYLHRAIALDQPLPPHEVGLAIYHLAARRGFLSNRKGLEKKDEDAGKVKTAISKLAGEIKQSGARTLGEYFSRLNPLEQRIRGGYTHRDMFKQEFDAIWEAQSVHHASLMNEELRRRVSRCIFFQRPLKGQKNLVGRCEHETRKRRCPKADLLAQEFRLVQGVANLRVQIKGEAPRPLTEEERKALVEILQTEGDLTLKAAKKRVGLPKGAAFSIEEGEETKLKGNRTQAELAGVWGLEAWKALSEETRTRIVNECRSIRTPRLMRERAMKLWGLDPEKAEALSEMDFEEGYLAISKEAIKKLLPLMRDGLHYAEAVKKVYGDRSVPTAVEQLPPIRYAMPGLRNPVVNRSLTELRKIINALVKKYGKPEMIRIELAREMRKTRDQRKMATKKNREREGERKKAAEAIIREAGISQPSRDDIERYLLAEECDWTCPYTGAAFNIRAILGDSPQYDVEHIIPFSRSLDNSFINKTLCDAHENRNRKRNQTPWEAYGREPARWEEMLQRVRRFKSKMAPLKLARFEAQDASEFVEGFTARQLNDTRYAARCAVEYLGALYGPQALLHVKATSGHYTHFLRTLWRMSPALGTEKKSRDDHRHHAVDAVAIALTTPDIIKALSEAAERGWKQKGRDKFEGMKTPFPGFDGGLPKMLSEIVVSHRVSRKVNGRIHEDTLYKKVLAKDEKGKPVEYAHIRKRLDAMTSGEIENIVDDAVRRAVQEKLGDGDPKKVFADPASHPVLKSKAGAIAIHKARIRKKERLMPLASDPARQRQVVSDANHHVEIFEVKDKKGKVKWEGRVVTRYEAMRRLATKQPVVDRAHPEGALFLFSLSQGDSFRYQEDGTVKWGHVRVISLSAQRIEFTEIATAQEKKKIIESGLWRKVAFNQLKSIDFRKVTITSIGEVRWAND